MIRVVLDSNVLVSGAIATRGALATIINAWIRGDFEVVVSTHIINEYEQTLSEPYFARRLAPNDLLSYVADVRARASVVAVPPVVPRVATHPEDDLILATAVAGAADYLVTGDRQLLALGSQHGVAIVSPAGFVDLLKLQP